MNLPTTTGPTQANPDLIDLYERYLEEDLSRAESTIGTYVDVLRRAERTLPAGLDGACGDELRDFVRGGRRRAKATRALYRAAIVGFFRWATDPADPRLDFDPGPLIPKVHVPTREARPIETSMLREIIGRAADPFRLWLILAAFAGLRCVEIAALDRADITAEHIYVRGKGDKVRVVPARPEVWRVVEPLPPGPLVVRASGERGDRRWVSQRANYHLQHTLGCSGVTIHRLRHWFGTAAYRSGEDILAVKELLGHANVATTQRYVQVASSRRARAVSGLPGLDEAA